MLAQSTGSAIQGTVTDEQGAVMPGASVVVANVQTGFTRDLVSDERGWYRATAIPPGDYEVRVTLQGFATQMRRGLTVTIGQEATVNVSLRARHPRGIRHGHRRGAAGGNHAQHARHDGDARVARQPAAHHAATSPAWRRWRPASRAWAAAASPAQGQTDRSNSYMVDGVSNDQIVTAGNARRLLARGGA